MDLPLAKWFEPDLRIVFFIEPLIAIQLLIGQDVHI
jgi:hypothetical protein